MPAAPEPRPRWTLTLEAQPTPDGAPAIVRLRRALKCLLRVFGLRCLSAVWTVPDKANVEPRRAALFVTAAPAGNLLADGSRQG